MYANLQCSLCFYMSHIYHRIHLCERKYALSLLENYMNDWT